MNSRERSTKLSHDVGKYIARAAINWPSEGPVPDVLHRMLLKDLYGSAATQSGSSSSASARFEELAAGLEGEALNRVRNKLQAIEGLEPKVRANDDSSVRTAVALALEIRALLNDWARASAEDRS